MLHCYDYHAILIADRDSRPKHEKKEEGETMKTNIISNGSKWAGEAPDTIEELIKVLDNHDLDLARFALHGFLDFMDSNGYTARDYEKHNVRIFGNFLTVSHVFNVEGVYESLRPLIEAIERNIKSQADRVTPRQTVTA